MRISNRRSSFRRGSICPSQLFALTILRSGSSSFQTIGLSKLWRQAEEASGTQHFFLSVFQMNNERITPVAIDFVQIAYVMCVSGAVCTSSLATHLA